MEVLIVGAGAMGRWVGATLTDPRTSIAFTDVDDDAAAAAAASVGGRTSPLDGDDAAVTFDLVCIAVPMSVTAEAVATHAPRAERAVIDVSGVMAGPIRAMAEHAPGRERVSLHPLFAPENAPGNVAVVVDEPGPVTDRVRDRLTDAGNELFETTPANHDAAMETVQAKAHAAVLAFALAADEVPPSFQTPISAALFDLVETVTGGTPRVYADIQSTFAGADDVAAAAARIADADGAAFERLYREASERSARSSSERPSSDRQSSEHPSSERP